MTLRTHKPTREERAAMTHDELLRAVWLLDEVIEFFRWIPVGERLPDRNGEYLVCLKDGMIDTEPFENGGWYFYQDVPIGVIAWTILPEPYKPD